MGRGAATAALIVALVAIAFGQAQGANAGSGSYPVASAAKQRPILPCLNKSGTAYKAKVEPAKCAHFGNGGAFAGGVNLKQLDWANWGAKIARGEGTECGFSLPCAQIPVSVRASRKRLRCGKRVYTRLRATSTFGTSTVKTQACLGPS